MLSYGKHMQMCPMRSKRHQTFSQLFNYKKMLRRRELFHRKQLNSIIYQLLQLDER